jgi:hypothetical protein
MGAGGLAGIVAGRLAGQAAGLSEGAPLAAAVGAEGSLQLRVGQRFGRWTVSAVHPLYDGALHVDVKGEDEHQFVLEILARDLSPLAPRPPAVTDGLAIFVRNGGDGWLPTAEEQGLAAMTLAHALSTSAQGGPVAGLLTYSERFARHQDTLTGEELTDRNRTA